MVQIGRLGGKQTFAAGAKLTNDSPEPAIRKGNPQIGHTRSTVICSREYEDKTAYLLTQSTLCQYWVNLSLWGLRYEQGNSRQ